VLHCLYLLLSPLTSAQAPFNPWISHMENKRSACVPVLGWTEIEEKSEVGGLWERARVNAVCPPALCGTGGQTHSRAALGVLWVGLRARLALQVH
jgi:hypothetical protein